MTVKDLINILETQPQDLEVIYRCFSEFCLLEKSDIQVLTAGLPREDGWVAFKRKDKPTREYLSFPGN